jgi:hypothetical protein
MKTQVGMWIDHREANIVFLSQDGEETKQIKSTVEKQLRRSGDSPLNQHFEKGMTPASDRREKGYMGHLANYYEEIVSVVRGAEAVFIFGPGEAKGELRKHFHKHNLCERIVGFETTDKMTKREIARKVRNFYIAATAIPLTNGDQLKFTNPYCFFAHIAFAIDGRALATPQATANLLIEINDTALRSGGNEKHREVSTLMELQKVELAGEIARTAASDYLKSESEFSNFPVQRFVDFNLTETPTYISIRPPPTKVLPNDSKVWRLAESESDRLRGKPLLQRTREVAHAFQQTSDLQT